jgi:hypothetical protein
MKGLRRAISTVVLTMRDLTRYVMKALKKISKLGFKLFNRARKALFRFLKKALIVLHHHAARRPHHYLNENIAWYNRWHSWNYHKHVHFATAAAYIFVVGAIIISSARTTFAADLTTTWDFSNPAEFVFDDDDVETNATTARLKAQNYATDDDTEALFHFDEPNGIIIEDSSANNNDGDTVGNAAFGTGNLNNAISLDGNGDYATVSDSASLSLSGSHTIEAWTKFDSAFDTNASQDQAILDKGSYKLYYDRTSGKINYEIANSSANSWTRAAGNDAGNSWDLDGKSIVRASVINGSNTYVGLGAGTGDAEVWKWTGSAWSQIGGDGKNGSWADQTFEDVNTLAVNGTTLYAGLGTNAAGDAEVWSCDMSDNCSDWTKIGGDAVNSSWAISTYQAVTSLNVMGGNLYAGIGVAANNAEVWRWNGSSWTKIGGDSINSGWTTNYDAVRSLTSNGSTLYAGLGDTATEAEVWSWNGSAWTKIGGDGVSSSWTTADNIEQVLSLEYFGGNLYAGTGLTAGDGDVWRYNGTSWTKIGGDNLNSGWAASTYEVVPSLATDGTNLYAGVGNSNGDGEVFRWNGSAWTKIGGDGVNSGFSANQGDGVYALSYGNSTLFSGLYDAARNGTLWSWNGSAWTWVGGGYVNQSWGFYNLQSAESSMTYNEKLYVGTGVSVAGNALVWEYDGSNWTVIGGQGVKSSWAADTFENVYALQTFEGELYASLGTTANDAEVWKYNGTSWTKIGGDSLNSGWTTNYEAVHSLTVYNGDLYAGIGVTATEGEVWRWNGSSWAKVGGDGTSSSWATAGNIESVLSMVVYDGQLYAGVGSTVNDADIWRYNGTIWTQVAGDGIASSWNSAYEEVFIMRVYNGKLIAGLGSGTDDAEVWEYNGSTWTKIGGDDVNSSWTGGTYERIRAMAIYNGELYAGIGDGTAEGEVWKWNGSSWTQTGGDSLNSGWTNVVEYVSTLIDYKGKLYAGIGNTANVDASVWSYGNNAFLSSTDTNQDTNWHHIAATYNGSTMKIYIDGVEDASASRSTTIPDASTDLLIGSTYGSGGRGEAQGYFDGSIDELRISSTARTSFTSKPYPATKKTIELAAAEFTSGVEAYEGFTTDESLDGGSIGYRLSDDDGATWQYWDGDEWLETVSLNDSNTAAEINSNIASFPVGFAGLKWQAVLSGDGDQQVTLNSVSVDAQSDAIAPDTNASGITASKTNGGANIASNDWTNGGSPYFSWTAGTDSGSGILGYCLYLGQDETADPVLTKGLLGTNPIDTNDQCQFTIGSNSIDLATSGLLGTALTTSNLPYYLSVKAIDRAGNVSASSAQFQFRFDNTPPTNPGFVSAPSGFINTKEATFTWPTSGGQAPSDAASGLAGLQYRIGATTWYGDAHTGTGTIDDLLDNDGTYTTVTNPDYDNIDEGTNTVYFRTWDQAGNVTTSYVSAALKVNTNGAPSEPLNLSVDPSSNTTNSFTFAWDAPTSFVGDEENLNYCYTINVEPSASNCTFTGAGITSLAAGPFATQPGENTMYVVARDESSNINYDNYSTVTFEANTPSPGIPTNIDIVDVSIKSTSKWRLALTWDAPVDDGAGISSYKVYRSTDNSSFSLAGSSSSTTYIDAGLSQQDYYYRIKACDSTNNCSANSTIVDMYPTGKFTTPATLTSEPESTGITTKRATIEWSTDRASDSKVALGTKSGSYGASEVGSSDQVTSHEIELDNLAAGTTYYYVVKWTDEDGNTGTSQEYSFTTKPAPVIKEVNPARVGLTSTTITFTAVGANKVNLYFGESESFGGLESINTSSVESSYSMELAGLKDGTKYFYQLSAFDSEGSEYKGNIFSFSTPPRPRITNLEFEPVKGEPTSTQSVTWTTNVPSTSTVTYGKVGTNGKDIQDSELVTEHKIIIRGLEDDSRYFLVAQSRDKDGNLATSDQQNFKTALDTRPPSVFDVTVEPSIRGTGAEARGQVIVSWKTDEPSTSQVGYAEGSSATVFNNKTTEDTQLTTEHIVVVSDLPTSRVYSIQPISYDKARNAGLGTGESAIIGRASESVLTVILNTLQRVFGL